MSGITTELYLCCSCHSSCFTSTVVWTNSVTLFRTLINLNSELIYFLRVGLKQTSFPFPEFIMALGFFTVLIVERIVLNYKEMRRSLEEREPLLPEIINSYGHGHGHGHGHGTSPDQESSGQHIHIDFQAHSPFRSLMLFLSLSLHSVFEGLAIGLQSTDSKVRTYKEQGSVWWIFHTSIQLHYAFDEYLKPR